ncbi:MAG: hypothetical protein ACAH83_20600 [Alphaproteobacteria bacterium]
MSASQYASVSPQDHIKNLEKFAADGDIKGMAESIGELHTQWDRLSGDMQADIMKLEAIFLSLLQARMKKVH